MNFDEIPAIKKLIISYIASRQLNQRTDFCKYSGHVTDLKHGYQKTFCLTEFPGNFQNSQHNCVKSGMELYQCDSFEANKTIIDFVRSQISPTVTDFFIDGSSGSSKINECTSISNRRGSFKIDSIDCSSTILSICEYTADYIPEYKDDPNCEININIYNRKLNVLICLLFSDTIHHYRRIHRQRHHFDILCT